MLLGFTFLISLIGFIDIAVFKIHIKKRWDKTDTLQQYLLFYEAFGLKII